MSSFVFPPTYVPGFHDEAAVRKMPYRKWGSRVVSQLSFGVSAIGGCYGNPGGQAEANEVIHTAIKRGINLIDAAPWYGHGKAESVLGEALKGIPREAYYVTTKYVVREEPSNIPTQPHSPQLFPPTRRLLGAPAIILDHWKCLTLRMSVRWPL